MYAVIKSGGKQYRVKAGETIRLEKLAGDPGSKVEFGDVLMVEDGGEGLNGRKEKAVLEDGTIHINHCSNRNTFF